LISKSLYRCPNCFRALKQGEKQYFCSKGHTFDIARKGYVNLLLPGHTGSGTPGDTKEMLRCRREFLDQGYYKSFSDKLNEIVISYLAKDKKKEETISLLDAGCGEGYYIWRLSKSLKEQYKDSQIDIYGIDVSKTAVNYACSRSKDIRFAVASNYHIPILDNSLDFILCSFAPRDEKEFSRILKASGKLIVAAPGPEHLFSLRQILYDSPDNIGSRGDVGEAFSLLDQYRVRYTINLKTNKDILNLFLMTPYSRHAEVDSIEGKENFTTEVDINILVYQKA